MSLFRSEVRAILVSPLEIFPLGIIRQLIRFLCIWNFPNLMEQIRDYGKIVARINSNSGARPLAVGFPWQLLSSRGPQRVGLSRFRGVCLTPAGLNFVKLCRIILAEIRIKFCSEGCSGLLRLLQLKTMLNGLLNCMIS